MTYRVTLPLGGRMSRLDVLEPNTTAVQRFIRRHGIGHYETATAATVLAWCELHDPGFVMFDIGANMGLYGELAAAMFSPARVHSFEPTPASAGVAARIARKNKLPITVHQVAISDEEGTAVLHVNPRSDTSNSLVEGFRTETTAIRVPTRTIDGIVAETGPPQLIKLDVETHERAVLDGGRHTFQTARPTLIVEVLRRRGTDHGREITAFFEDMEYRFYELSADPTWVASPVLRGSGTTDRDWLVSPDTLPAGFGDRWAVWHERLLACGADSNPRIPIMLSARAAYRRGGLREIAAAARRHLGR